LALVQFISEKNDLGYLLHINNKRGLLRILLSPFLKLVTLSGLQKGISTRVRNRLNCDGILLQVKAAITVFGGEECCVYCMKAMWLSSNE